MPTKSIGLARRNLTPPRQERSATLWTEVAITLFLSYELYGTVVEHGKHFRAPVPSFFLCQGWRNPGMKQQRR